jgi:hypothetical protein
VIELQKREAKDVILALRIFANDIRELMDAIADRTSISRDEKEDLQSKFKDLKARLKVAGNLGTVDGTKRPLTRFESAFFQPATHSASVNCLVAVNTHPIRSNWFSCLYGMEIDIQHMLGQLEQMYSGV